MEQVLASEPTYEGEKGSNNRLGDYEIASLRLYKAISVTELSYVDQLSRKLIGWNHETFCSVVADQWLNGQFFIKVTKTHEALEK